MKTFAIFETATGNLISHETDDALQRLTDAQLTAKGLSRIEVPEQLPVTKSWDPVTRTQVPIPPKLPDAELQAILDKAKNAPATLTVSDLFIVLQKRGLI